MEFLHNKCWTSYSFVAADTVQYQLGNRLVPSYWQKALFYCFGNIKVANGIVVIIVALLLYPSWGKFCLYLVGPSRGYQEDHNKLALLPAIP